MVRSFMTTAIVIAQFVFAPLLVGQEKEKGSSETDAKTNNLVKVFKIQNGDATELKNVVHSIFPSDQDGNRLISVRVAVDARTNSIVASGPEGDLQVVEHLLSHLDDTKVQAAPPAANQKTTSIYRLQNAPASDVADAINQWWADRCRTTLGKPGASDNECGDQLVVVPELVSNSLIVSTPSEGDLEDEIKKIIRALDTRPDMVKIKVVIKKTVDGKETIVSTPQILTVDQVSGRVSVGMDKENYTIELTPYVIAGDKPTEVTEVTNSEKR